MGAGEGAGAGSAALTGVLCRSRCSAVCVATTASSRSRSRPRAHRTLGRQLLLHRSERFLELLSLSLSAASLHLLQDARGRALFRGRGWCCGRPPAAARLPPARRFAPSGLAVRRPIAEGGRRCRYECCDGNIAIACKLTPLVWPIGWVRRMRRLRHWRCFSEKAKGTSHLQFGCTKACIRRIVCHNSVTCGNWYYSYLTSRELMPGLATSF